MLSNNDPVGQGFVESLAHPGGNIAGLTHDSAKIAAKRVQLFQLAIPHLARVAVLLYPDDPYAQAQSDQLEQVATALNLVLRRIMVRQACNFADAFEGINRDRQNLWKSAILKGANPANLPVEPRGSQVLAGHLSVQNWTVLVALAPPMAKDFSFTRRVEGRPSVPFLFVR